jgi:hypothetical protein
MEKIIIKTITEEEKKAENYHKIKVAYDDDINTLVLVDDITQNMEELKCGMTWHEIYNDLEINEDISSKKIESGIYFIEFIAWGYQEPDTENGYGDGDSNLELLSIEKYGDTYN